MYEPKADLMDQVGLNEQVKRVHLSLVFTVTCFITIRRKGEGNDEAKGMRI